MWPSLRLSATQACRCASAPRNDGQDPCHVMIDKTHATFTTRVTIMRCALTLRRGVPLLRRVLPAQQRQRRRGGVALRRGRLVVLLLDQPAMARVKVAAVKADAILGR